MEKLEGKVINIIFSSETGFKILQLQTNKNIITVKGSLPTVEIGENLQCMGKYVEHKDFGLQFEISTFEKVFPEETEDILSYLESGVIKKIGVKTAKKIVDKFGKDTLDIMYLNPERLAEISGISKRGAIEIGLEFKEKRAFLEVVEYLKKYNLEYKEISRMYEVLKVDTISVIKKNPYIILNYIPSVKFTDLDRIAINEGVDLNSENRIKASIKYAMNLSLKNGNTYSNYNNLLLFVIKLTGAEKEYIEKCVKDMAFEHFLDITEDKVSLESIAIAEKEIAENLKILNNGKLKSVKNIEKRIKELEKKYNIVLTDVQKEAVTEVNKNNVIVITGGAGTRKNHNNQVYS